MRRRSGSKLFAVSLRIHLQALEREVFPVLADLGFNGGWRRLADFENAEFVSLIGENGAEGRAISDH